MSCCWVNRIPNGRDPFHLCTWIQLVPVSFCLLRPPSNIKASVRRVPAFPGLPSQPPPSQPKFAWPPARMSANSPALCADVAHDQFWHHRPSFQCHPRLYCSPVLPKNLLVPKRRHRARPSTAQTRCRCVGECLRLCLGSQRVRRGGSSNCVRAKSCVVCYSTALYCGSPFSSTCIFAGLLYF